MYSVEKRHRASSTGLDQDFRTDCNDRLGPVDLIQIGVAKPCHKCHVIDSVWFNVLAIFPETLLELRQDKPIRPSGTDKSFWYKTFLNYLNSE